jgi:hypothetical protein
MLLHLLLKYVKVHMHFGKHVIKRANSVPIDRKQWSTSFEVDKNNNKKKNVNFVHLHKHPQSFWETSQGQVVLVYFILVDKIYNFYIWL